MVLIHSNSHWFTPLPFACKRKRTASERPMCPAICSGVQPAKTWTPRSHAHAMHITHGTRMARAWHAAVRCLRCPQPRGAESISRPPRREQVTADRRPQVTTAKPKSTHTTHTTHTSQTTGREPDRQAT